MNELVVIKRTGPTTTSLVVAEKFGKRHDVVIRKIENLMADFDKDLHIFEEIFYQDSYGRDQKMYEMDRRAFSLLAMRFTGKKALAWQSKFLDAFEQMEKTLLQRQNDSWKQLRIDGKTVRHELTDEIKTFIEYATAQGSKSAVMYYTNITSMTSRALFLIGRKAPQAFRDMLNNMQLSFLQTCEFVARNALKEGMESGLHYKEIYQLARDKVTAVAATVGKTQIPGLIEDGKRKLI